MNEFPGLPETFSTGSERLYPSTEYCPVSLTCIFDPGFLFVVSVEDKLSKAAKTVEDPVSLEVL